MRDTLDIMPVLRHDGVVQPVLLSDLLKRNLARPRPGHHSGRVRRDDVRKGEGDDRESEEDEHQKQKSPNDQPRDHSGDPPGSMRSRIELTLTSALPSLILSRP